MRRLHATGLCAIAALVLSSTPPATVAQPAPDASGRRMSFHNRLLLNRALLTGIREIEVLVLVERPAGAGDRDAIGRNVAALVERLGGRTLRTEEAIGYLRIAIPPDQLVELARSRLIEAYQISSLSRGAWYRDGPPLSNAQVLRGFEVTPVAAAEPINPRPDLPLLTPAEARHPGFTADDDVGVGRWMAEHPTYDGRGVTIAVLENALASFADPVFRTAKTIDGRDVPKIAGILNAISPEHPDETRVLLDRVIESSRAWVVVENRTYVLPKPGRYRFGILKVSAGDNVVHQFAIVEDEANGEIRMDANGDASFQDERPLADVNERFEPGLLTVTFPRKVQASFVMARGPAPHVVHIYLGRSRHQSMTASVAAGGRSDQSLASGVAPNARVLLVRMNGLLDGTEKVIEGFIEAAKRPDVDVLSASTGLGLVPDTARDFVGLLFARLTTTYSKPIVTSAGNFGAMLAHIHAHGSALSTGGTLGPATYEAFYGGRRLPQLIVHPTSASGPALDGAIKPDILAPVERIAVNPPWNASLQIAPLNAPTRRVPPGYEISCCTSASSPYAAGVIALLISAAKQADVPYTAEGLMRALRATAQPIPGFPAHQQGHGAIDIHAAWEELRRRRPDPPRIVASATVVHPLAQYAARGSEGQGIFEVEGWTAGRPGTREIRLRRETGPAEPIAHTLRWRADEGTFVTPPSISLPLGETVVLPVRITPPTAGAHSGLLTLHDPDTGAVVFRTQATVVAPQQVDAVTHTLEIKGTAGLMRENTHYLHVPRGVRAVEVELEVTRGVVRPGITRSHGLISNYYQHAHPMEIFGIGTGRYHVLLPNPQPGTWEFRIANKSARYSPQQGVGPASDDDAEYSLRMKLLSGAVRTSGATSRVTGVEIENTGSELGEPVLEAWPAMARLHRGSFQSNGLANTFDIQVPTDAATLLLDLRSDTTTELFLYDCTTGECFSYDVAFPANTSHRFIVRRPAPGRWVAAVNAAPFPAAGGSFTLDEVVATGERLWRRSGSRLPAGASWREKLDLPPASETVDGHDRVVLVQLLDAAAERREEQQPWSSHPRFVRLRDRPVAIGTAIIRPDR